MIHVVFLLGSYYPEFSAVGYCAYQVQKQLTKEFDITVVALRNDPALPMEETHHGIRILRVDTRDIRRRSALKAADGKVARAGLFADRARGAMHRLLAPETIDRSIVRAYLARLDTMAPQPQVIVPLVFPFETVMAALEYKKANPGVRILPYLFDDFVESGSLHVLKVARWLKRKRHLELERRMLTEACAVLSMHPLRRHFEANFEGRLLDKLTFLEHPLLLRPPHDECRPDDGSTRLCFTGSLIRNVREPDYLLDLLRAVRLDTPARADFYVMGNAASKVKTEAIGDAMQIVNHGEVSKPEADAAVREADVLLNIGEVNGRQISSKIFEYMSSGKPIIHLYHKEHDSVSEILKKYPLSISLPHDTAQFEDNVLKLNQFLNANRRRLISFDEIEHIYPEAMPETTAVALSKMLLEQRAG